MKRLIAGASELLMWVKATGKRVTEIEQDGRGYGHIKVEGSDSPIYGWIHKSEHPDIIYISVS